MKNGYTPTEYAHSVAIDALIDALHNRNGDFDDLPRREILEAKKQIQKLIKTLSERAKLDTLY